MKFIKTFIITIAFLIGTTSFAIAQNHGDKPGELPDNVDTSDCTAKPPAKSFDMKLKWETKEFSGEEDPHVCGSSTPLVADMDGDGYPEVVAVHIRKSSGHSNTPRPSSFMSRDLCVFDGKTGNFKYMVKTAYYQLHGQPIALGDVDNDGCAEIFIVSEDGKVYCYKGNQANANADDYLWIGHSTNNSTVTLERQYIPMLADLNNDGITELVCGESIFNANTGVRILAGSMQETGRGFGSPHNIHGDWQLSKIDDGKEYYLVAVADIDGDKNLEICAGDCIYKPTITNPTGVSGNKWKLLRQCKHELPYDNIYDGQTMVLDFDNDGDLDVCVLGRRIDMVVRNDFQNGKSPLGVYFWEGQTDELLGYFICDPKSFSQSIPFAGDLNGDGFPEIVFNGPTKGWYWTKDDNYRDRMHVFRYKQGNTRVANPACKAKNIEELFSDSETAEFSSYSGFTVFDFNQDNKAEIVYRNRESLYILDGTTLRKLCPKRDCFSGNTSEYPIVADVDCDGHADIVVSAQYIYSPGAIENSENDRAAGRIKVFESETPGAWGPARKIWNQWPYNVVNINEDGTIPRYQFNISTPFGPRNLRPFNAFLQQATLLNKDGEMFSPSANAFFISDSSALQVWCDSITFDITFSNDGTESLYAPYGLTIYKDQYKGTVIHTETYNNDLMKGDEITLHLKYEEADLASLLPIQKFIITINDIGTGIAKEGDQQGECDTTDNRIVCNFDGFRTAERDTVTEHICLGDTYSIGESIYTESGEYTDTLINRFGCDSIVTSYLYVHSISVDLGPDQEYCSKAYVPVTLDAGEAASYEWQDGSGNRTFIVNEEGGDFSVKVFDEYGCSDSDDVTVNIIPNPEVYITQDPTDFCLEYRATLTAHSSEPDVTYLWNTHESSESINVTSQGTYSVEADNQGCKGMAFIKIPICPCEVWIPNAFTPNNDGLNDIFIPQIENALSSYHLYIYNRWGEQIFYTDDPTLGWDGTVKGQLVPAGVYQYVVSYTCASTPDADQMKHGSITVIR